MCLYDYDPYKMGHGGGAEQQLNFRKGDVITVIGDIDIDGYYSAELHGMFFAVLFHRRALFSSSTIKENPFINSTNMFNIFLFLIWMK